MDIESQNASNASSRRIKKSSRRGWTRLEEMALIEKMKKLATQGWRSDGGFRRGYITQLEQHMITTFPDTDIKARPHIESKIQVWKRQHAGLFSLIGKNGTAWNPDTKMLEVTDEVWNAYGKTNKHLKGLRWRQLPFYPDWCEVFGQDRATRKHARDFENILSEKNLEILNEDNLNAQTPILVEDPNMSISNGDNASMPSFSTKGKGKKKQRVNSSSDAPFINLLENFCERVDSRLTEIAKRVGHDHDVSTARKEVYQALCQLPELSEWDQVKVGQRLAYSEQDMEYFFSLPTSAKLVFVRMILNGLV